MRNESKLRRLLKQTILWACGCVVGYLCGLVGWLYGWVVCVFVWCVLLWEYVDIKLGILKLCALIR
jgi:hypothetical protein